MRRSGINHRTLRELFRNLQAFEALFEADGIDTLIGPDGVEYCLHDIQYLYGCRKHLSRRQRQAIELFLYKNIREREVAIMMGVAPTNPIAIYATQGLVKLCALAEAGDLTRYRAMMRKGRDADAVAAWGSRSVGRGGDGTDPQVSGGGDGPLGEERHPDTVEGEGPAEPGGLHDLGSGRRLTATGDVPPGMESGLASSERPGRSPASTEGAEQPPGVRGPGMAERSSHVERPRGLRIPLQERPESEILMVAGIMPRNFIPTPISRWGTQARYKCQHCTRYMAPPHENGEMTCRHCGCFYQPYGPDLYSMVVPG